MKTLMFTLSITLLEFMGVSHADAPVTPLPPAATPMGSGFYEFETVDPTMISVVGDEWTIVTGVDGREYLQTTGQGVVTISFTGEWLIFYRATNPDVADKPLQVCFTDGDTELTDCVPYSALPGNSGESLPFGIRGSTSEVNTVAWVYGDEVGAARLDNFTILNGQLIAPETTQEPQIIYVPYNATQDTTQSFTFENEGVTYTGRVDNTITAGDLFVGGGIIAVTLVLMCLIVMLGLRK